MATLDPEEIEKRLKRDRVIIIKRPEQRPNPNIRQYEQRREELKKLAAERKHRIYMEKDLRDFPYRKEIFSPNMKKDLACAFCDVEGEHFSDSCPR
uniref:CCHC-type domain-containing protein n=1 Tax=Haemonchus placei TaxID=6290 RepID=A0A0N4W774_HAEPC